jgi:hypothetical protein
VGRPPPLLGAFLALMGRVVCMRDKFILNETQVQEKIYIFGRHMAWLKYFTYYLVSLLVPNHKQHIFSPAKVSFLSVSQHVD